MEEAEEDSETKVDFEVDFEEAKEAVEAISASRTMTADVIPRFAGKRSVLSGRKRDAGRPTIRMKSAKPPVRSCSLRITLQAQPPVDFSVYLAEYEGNEHINQYNQGGWIDEDYYDDDDNDGDQQYGIDEQHFTGAYVEHRFYKEQCLADQAFLHHISGDDIYGRGAPSIPASQFLIEDHYTRSVYQGILPDTGAANVSTVGKEQYLALAREDPTVTMDTSTAGKASLKFGKGSVTASVGTVQVSTEIGEIYFEVLEALTLFLLCLADMDRLKVYFNNTTDELV